MSIGASFSCSALKSFAKCWDLAIRRRSTRSTQLGLQEALEIVRINSSGELTQHALYHSQNLINSLNTLIDQLRKEITKQIEIFEAFFVLSYFEDKCPQECLNELVRLSRRIQWVSAVARAYSSAKTFLSSRKEESRLMKTLYIHLELMEKKYLEELFELKFLCSRLVKLCDEIFYIFNVIPSINVTCGD